MSQNASKRPIGEVLQKANLISASQIDVALRDQQRYQNLNLGNIKIGEILALRGWLKQETTDFFAQKWTTLIRKKNKQPLGYYLQEAALLNEEQVKYLLQEQQKLPIKLRLGELAYIEGWLNLKTVNYFVDNLYSATTQNKLSKTTFSLSSEHQLIRKYEQGKTDFVNLNLDRVYLKNVVLQGIQLDNSQLEKAFLQEANLNHASLTAANLHRANLTKALLRNANLQDANLSHAQAKEAFLESANLQNANLQQANLEQASLIKASLEGANLTGAKLQGTLFYGASYDETTTFDAYFNPLHEGMNFTGTYSESSQLLFL